MIQDIPMFHYIAAKLCKHLGHRWRYKDYRNHIKENGDRYEFEASRNCSRCGQNAYFYTEWKNEAKLQIDTESDYHFLRKIIINKVSYS